MSMTLLLTGLLAVLVSSLLAWSVETFVMLPRRQAALVRSYRTGALDEEGLSIALVATPTYVEIIRWGSGLSLLGLLALAMLGRVDIDFSLVLVIATFLCGLGWLLDVLLTRRIRQRHARDLVKYATSPLAPALRTEPPLVEYAHSFFPVLAIVLVLRSFLVEPFTIPSGSMLPTLEVGDYILVNKYAYGLRLPVTGTEIVPVGKPQRGDIMVFRFPPRPTMNFIKRVIGVPGDRIRTDVNGDLYVNDRLATRRLIRQEPAVNPWEMYFEEDLNGVKHTTRQEAGSENRRRILDIVVPEGHYFMMGDNRDNSKDSRYWCSESELTGCVFNPADNAYWGAVPERMIVGKAVYIWIHKDPGLNLPTFGRNGPVQ